MICQSKKPTIMLEIKDVSFSYLQQNIPVINNFSGDYAAGESILVVGDNGTGKSTLGKIICGIINPQKGMVSVDNQSLSKLAPKKRIHIAYYINQINQLQFLNSSLTAEIRSFEKLSGRSFSQVTYNSFFLPPNLDYNPFELSVNQAWRFSLFLSTIINPKVLFVDEIPSPTNERNRSVLKELLESRGRDKRVTFFSYQRKIDLIFDKVIYIK